VPGIARGVRHLRIQGAARFDIGVQRDIEAKSKTRWALYKPVSPVTAAAPKLTDGPAGTRA